MRSKPMSLHGKVAHLIPVLFEVGGLPNEMEGLRNSGDRQSWSEQEDAGNMAATRVVRREMTRHGPAICGYEQVRLLLDPHADKAARSPASGPPPSPRDSSRWRSRRTNSRDP